MESMSIDAAVASIGAQVVGAATSGMSAGAAALPVVTALAPAGADLVSLQASTAFAAEGAQMLATLTAAQEELGRAGVALTDIARIYTEVDGQSAHTVATASAHTAKVQPPHQKGTVDQTGLYHPAPAGGNPVPVTPVQTAPPTPAPPVPAFEPGVAEELAGGLAAPNLSTHAPSEAAPAAQSAGTAATSAASSVGPRGIAPASAPSPVSAVSEGASPGAASGRGLAPPMSSINYGASAGGPVSGVAPAAHVTPMSSGAPASGVVAPGVASRLGRDRHKAAPKSKTPERVSATNQLSGRRHRWSVLDLFNLQGKRALVTGVSGGIGQMVALAYLQAGAHVAIAAQDAEILEKVADEIAADGDGKVVPICCDLAQPEQVNTMLGQVTAELGGVDIAVCNAGTGSVGGMLNMPVAEFQRIQNTNVTGVFLAAQAAARAMVAQERGGVIINTASISGHIVNVPQQVGHYCAAKAAVIHLTKAMAVEFAPYKIRVNSVSPGYILSEPVEPLADHHLQWQSKIPLGRMGRPEELAGLYVYLASAASSYMTGSDIVIDGGYTCL
jgi:sorbose reductase